MDLTWLRPLFEDGATPLVRTDFSDDRAWDEIVGAVTAGDEAGELEPNIRVVTQTRFEGLSAEELARNWVGDRVGGYVLLADRESMRRSEDRTVVYVDLAEKPGRRFRTLLGEVLEIEVNLSISNMDFHEFADGVGPDGVFRGFRSQEQAEPTHLSDIEVSGIAACEAIGRDLDREPGSRALSGELGEVAVQADLTGSLRRYFELFAQLYGWWGAFRPAELRVGNEYALHYREDWPQNAICGTWSEIRCNWLDYKNPTFVVHSWNWFVPALPRTRVEATRLEPVLDAPSILRFDLSQTRRGEELAATSIQVSHTGLPRVWVEDMADFWRYRLQTAERVYALNYQD